MKNASNIQMYLLSLIAENVENVPVMGVKYLVQWM